MGSTTPISAEANLLRAHVDSLGAAGSTSEGKAWCIKALHPAEPTIEHVAIPDGCPTDTVRLSLTYSTTVSLPTAAANWDLNLTLVPSPTAPICIETVGVGGSISSFRTPFFAGSADANMDYAYLSNMFSSWRLTHQSLTGHLDANATTDTGSVAATLFPLRPTMLLTGGRAAEGYFHQPPVACFEDSPTYAQIMQMPRSYQNNLRKGFYLPLKLSNTHQHWRHRGDNMSVIRHNSVLVDGPVINGDVHLPGANVASWPFPDILSAAVAAGVFVGGQTPSLLNDYCGLICCRNISPSSSIVLKLKLGLEGRVRPASTQTPFLRPAAPCDTLAMSSYYAVCSQLEDCYPAEWNDNGKLLGAISRGLGKIAPFLSAIPGYGGVLGPVASGLGGLAGWGADAMGSTKRRGRKGKKPKQQAVATTTADSGPPSYPAPGPPRQRKPRKQKQKQRP